MEIWEQLTAAAVLGTDRQAFTLPPQEGPLGAMLSRLPASDGEHLLLGAAAATALYRRAGRAPATLPDPLPDPCPEERSPVCTPRLRELLAVILSGQHQQVIAEWLSLVAGAGLRAPHDLLPALLAIGEKNKPYREHITSLIGRRGRWLAQFNPEWSYALAGAEVDESGWQSEHFEVRKAAFRLVRAADPARAREMLADVWEQEPPKQRAALLEMLAAGLCLEDEPFLEAALDDKRKEVRTVAIDLLSQLPGSRLVREMTARVEQLLTFTPGQPMRLLPPTPARKPRLDVTLPEACDKAMARVGIEAKTTYWTEKLGEKSWWLLQMLGKVPPSHWCAAWHSTPEALIALAAEGEWKIALLSGWAMATIRFRDTAWATPLLLYMAGTSANFIEVNWWAMLQVLPAGEWEALALKSAQTPEDVRGIPLQQLLDGCPTPWNAPLSGAVLRQIGTQCATENFRTGNYWSGNNARLGAMIKSVAQHTHVALIPQAERVLQEAFGRLDDEHRQGHWNNVFTEAFGLLQLRGSLYQASEEARAGQALAPR